MTKSLKIIALSALLIGAPICSMAEEMLDGPESEVVAKAIVVTGNHVRVCGISDDVLYVFNLAGVKVASYRIDSTDKTLEVDLPRGCYIFKIGNLVRKVSIK